MTNIKNRVIYGDNTSEVYNKLDETTESKPKKGFIEVGINDLLKNNSLDSILLYITTTLLGR